jgi:hypothetical protein
MTLHPLPDDGPALRPQQAAPDTASAYDSTWTEQPPEQQPEGLERVMLSDAKIYVVLAVVLLVWIGVVTLLWRTDRKIDRLERRVDADRSSSRDS